MPVGSTAGCVLNNPFASFVTMNDSDWELSLAGPGLIPLAQPATVWGPASSATVWSLPAVKLGGSLTGWTVSIAVSVAVLNAVVPPLMLGSPVPPLRRLSDPRLGK